MERIKKYIKLNIFGSLDELKWKVKKRNYIPEISGGYSGDFIKFKNYFFDSKELIEKAEEIMFNKVAIFNEVYNLEENFDWNIDFKSGYIFKDKFYKKIDIVNLSNDADVKIPWELSRMQHLLLLGQAYSLTEEKKYFLKFIEHIESWNRKNPYCYSVNWTCAMEVAIRAVNLIQSNFYFRNCYESNEQNDFIKKFNLLIYNHGQYIIENLENTYSFTTNHYISDLIGLIWISLYFQGTELYKNDKYREVIDFWWDFAKEELNKEIEIQFNDDGGNYEGSTAYHSFVTEMLFYTNEYCNSNEKTLFTHNSKKKYKSALNLIANIQKANNEIPLIGDMDSGRFLQYFHGKNYKKQYKNVIQNITKKHGFFSYESSGYYIWKNEQNYFIVKCGLHGSNNFGNHAHNDQLSYELNIENLDFIVDSGMSDYTGNPLIRNKMRSTSYHNTVSVEGFEQNDISKNLFFLENQTDAKVVFFDLNNLTGEHQGFLDKVGCLHRRKFHVQNFPEEVIIIDQLIGKQKTIFRGEAYMNLHPSVIVKEYSLDKIKLERQKIELEILFDKAKKVEIIQESFYSSEYGERVKNKKIKVEFDGQLVTKIKKRVDKK